MRTSPRGALAYLPLILAALALAFTHPTPAQSAGSSGNISGSVTDPTAAAVPGATILLQNTISGFSRTAKADASGLFTFSNIPFNPYQLIVSSPGFGTSTQRIDLRTSVTSVQKIVLQVASAGETVTVEAPQGDLVENSPTVHVDIDRALFERLPLESQSSSVSSLITLAAPGVSADSNGLFHGLGDHAENAFYVDGQPVTDQQSKVFSNQLPISAIQSLEVISGAPPAEFGEKTSLVASITTRSGQGTSTPTGEFLASYGSFGSSTASADLAFGSKRFGNFTALDFLNTGRFLDPAEFVVFHDRGNVENLFNRVDYQPSLKDSAHLNLSLTRSWFQTPNTFDNLNVTGPTGASAGNADQRAKIVTFNAAPSTTRTLGDNSVLTLGTWVRRDAFNYYPSKNPFADLGPIQQETVSQTRSLMNAGGRLDLNYTHGVNNLKTGASYQQTFLDERFRLGIVDPVFNSPCITAAGAPVPGFNSPAQCIAAGYLPNTVVSIGAPVPVFNPLLACLDLTRPTPAPAANCASGTATPFLFTGHTDIKLLSLYAQDVVTAGKLSLNLGVRGDLYNGLSVARQAQPRVGISYSLPRTNTILRASYARTLETPFNENLILSSKGCSSPVISALVPCIPANFNSGFRNELHGGFEQSVGKHFIFNGDYIFKHTHNGYDFSVLGATPITFPIEWHNSKITGFAIRGNVTQIHGFSAFVVMSSVAARFFPPQIGGLGATNTSGAPFRIDHDEKFNQTTNLQYQKSKNTPFVSFNWRFDSGQVAGQAPYALNSTTPVNLSILTADEQLQAGLMCGGLKPTLSTPLTTCAPSQYHSTLISLPAPGTENDDHNPPRIAPRNLFDLSLGQDNLFPKHGDVHTFSAHLTVTNLADKVALYNFLSTFSGTHYVSPRTLTAELGYHF